MIGFTPLLSTDVTRGYEACESNFGSTSNSKDMKCIKLEGIWMYMLRFCQEVFCCAFFDGRYTIHSNAGGES